MGRNRAFVSAVVQARMTSSRLPGKVLAEIAGRPALQLLVERMRMATELQELRIATSADRSDDPVAELATRLGLPVTRGPLDDVLGRYRLALDESSADAVVRVTGDCPLIDPAVVDEAVSRWRSGESDYVSNTVDPRTYPDGLDVEVVSAVALREADAKARDAYEREHVTAFVRHRPDRYAAEAMTLDPPHGELRITLDTPEDLELIRAVAEDAGPAAGLHDLIDSALRRGRPRDRPQG